MCSTCFLTNNPTYTVSDTNFLHNVRYELPHNSTRNRKNSVDILWESISQANGDEEKTVFSHRLHPLPHKQNTTYAIRASPLLNEMKLCLWRRDSAWIGRVGVVGDVLIGRMESQETRVLILEGAVAGLGGDKQR